MLNVSSGVAIWKHSYNEAYDWIKTIVANSYQWPTARASVAMKVTGINEVSDVTILSAQVAALNNIMKGLCATQASPTATPVAIVVAATTTSETTSATCAYCNGRHLFEDCPNIPISINYVGNYNKKTILIQTPTI